MLLLAADTSGKQGSLALALCGPDGTCEVLEVMALTGGTFSAQFIPQVAGLLAKHGYGKQEIDAFAVVSGPGSFTGLRVGLAAIKALAEALAKPIATVSLLEAVFVTGRTAERRIAALDAGRGEVYTGKYEGCASLGGAGEERLLLVEEFLAAARGSVVVTPDGNIAEAARNAGLEVEVVERPLGDTIARLGWKNILSNITVPPEELDANYIRRSDAEIFAKPV